MTDVSQFFLLDSKVPQYSYSIPRKVNASGILRDLCLFFENDRLDSQRLA